LSAAPVLVLGIGNALMGDDGVGGRVVEALRAGAANGSLDLPPGAELVDGGTLGLDLLPWLAEARAAVLVDAAFVGGAPGTIAVWRDDPAAGGADAADEPGATGLADLLAAARLMGALPDAVSLVGIQPDALGARDGLSVAVEAALPAAVEATLTEARRVDALSRGERAGDAPEGTQTAGVTA
jgi:hydrogenase maturation protease